MLVEDFILTHLGFHFVEGAWMLEPEGRIVFLNCELYSLRSHGDWSSHELSLTGIMGAQRKQQSIIVLKNVRQCVIE